MYTRAITVRPVPLRMHVEYRPTGVDRMSRRRPGEAHSSGDVEMTLPEVATATPPPNETDWLRGDYVFLKKQQQTVIAAGSPPFEQDEPVWVIASDIEDWTQVGTLVFTSYVDGNEPELISHARRDPNIAADVAGVAVVPARSLLLEEANTLITGDRNASYGSPVENFSNTAEIWTVQFRHMLRPGARFKAAHVSQAMMSLKLARMVAQPKRDNYLDIAGYAGCGWECEEEQA